MKPTVASNSKHIVQTTIKYLPPFTVLIRVETIQLPVLKLHQERPAVVLHNVYLPHLREKNNKKF